MTSSPRDTRSLRSEINASEEGWQKHSARFSGTQTTVKDGMQGVPRKISTKLVKLERSDLLQNLKLQKKAANLKSLTGT